MNRPSTHALTLATVVASLAAACGSSDDEGGAGGEAGTASGGSAGSAGSAASAGSAGTAGGGGTGGTSSSGGSGGGGAVVPIEGPNETWTWVDFPESKCANGSPTGIGVNLTDRSDKVAIHLMGGGACWDQLTCDVAMTAVFLNGFPKEALAAQSSLGDGMFTRDASKNPFADYNLVFVPYCTGDVHAGSNPSGPTGKAFVGYDNFGHYLRSLVAKFPSASQVVVTGSSAGGFGTLVNFARVADAFPESEVLLLDDSGPAMAPKYLTPEFQKTTMQDAWAMDRNLPEACPDVAVGSVHEIYACLSRQYPSSRMGLVATLRDNVILTFFKLGNPALDAAGLEEGTNDIADSLLTDLPNWRVFFLPGSGHTVLMDDLTKPVVSGVVLADWTRALLEDDASWANVRP